MESISDYSNIFNLPKLSLTVHVYYEGAFIEKYSVTYNNVVSVPNQLRKDQKFRYHILLTLNAYQWNYIYSTIKESRTYRTSVLWNLATSTGKSAIKVAVNMIIPPKEFIDESWSEKLSRLIHEKSELDVAMSWLSTLGGAFSALGDNYKHCAKIAATISVQQFKIAMKLGEEPLLARCRLYMALSMIQLGNLKTAKQLILEQYYLARKIKDKRLENMCRGVWAKFNYAKQIKRNSILFCN